MASFNRKKFLFCLFLIFCVFFSGCGNPENTSPAFYFAENPWSQPVLWKSDGTTAGTYQVKRFPRSAPSKLVQTGDNIWFIADEPASIKGVWTSDGSDAGTVLVKGNTTEISNLLPINGNLYFLAVDGLSWQLGLWKINTVSHESTLLKAFPAAIFITDMCRSGDDLLFGIHRQDTDTDQLWISDGTPGGTTLFTATENSGEFAQWVPFDVGAKKFYVTQAGLWVTDGTPSGSTLLKATGSTYGLNVVADVGNSLVFLFGSETQQGFWRTDGSVAGTEPIFNLPSDPINYFDLADVGQQVFFVLGKIDTEQSELWVSDGTQGGTQLLKTTSAGMEILNLRGEQEKVFFGIGNLNQTSRPQLWTSDGTISGTVMVTDFPASKFPTFAGFPEKFLNFDGKNYYFLNQDVLLWKTDGTEAGTELIKNLRIP